MRRTAAQPVRDGRPGSNRLPVWGCLVPGHRPWGGEPGTTRAEWVMAWTGRQHCAVNPRPRSGRRSGSRPPRACRFRVSRPRLFMVPAAWPRGARRSESSGDAHHERKVRLVPEISRVDAVLPLPRDHHGPAVSLAVASWPLATDQEQEVADGRSHVKVTGRAVARQREPEVLALVLNRDDM